MYNSQKRAPTSRNKNMGGKGLCAHHILGDGGGWGGGCGGGGAHPKNRGENHTDAGGGGCEVG